MRRTLTVSSLALVALLSVARPASADTTTTLAQTFALTLAGTIIGAYGLPYVLPAVAPTVGSAYAATAGAVNGALTPIFSAPATVAAGYTATAGAIDGALTTAGTYTVMEPRLIGAIGGMAIGLISGLYVFSEPAAEEVATGPVETTNTVVMLQQ
ncbi:hypothetical protein [Thalassobaculum sp.]|uniref:hypothetical protein n=1 Tax=Thalassobaculum sp. TaxID=2022740 RepID=UPI003B5B879C